MDKQIEEMTKETCGQQIYPYGKDRPICWLTKEDCTCRADNQCDHYEVCERIYNAGYRKTPEGVVDYIENYKEGFKEGVVAVQTQLKEKCKKLQDKYSHICKNKYEAIQESCRYEGVTAVKNSIDEICKELVDE